MESTDRLPDEWNITASVGSIVFHVYVDSAFLGSRTQRHTERHAHSTYEFHILTGGSGTILTDEAEYEAAAGSYYIVKAGVYHKQIGSALDPIRKLSFKFEFDIEYGVGRGYSEEEIRNILYVLSGIRLFYAADFRHIKWIVDGIQAELSDKAIGYYAKVQHLFSLLFIQTVRDIALSNKKGYSIPDPRKSQDNRNNVIDTFFDMNYCGRASSQELCRLAHVSKSQLNRILRERYGMSFKQKQMESRIEHIKDMLVHTDWPIGKISEAAGYSSECNFTTFFKHMTGISPKTYRKSHGKEPAGSDAPAGHTPAPAPGRT